MPIETSGIYSLGVIVTDFFGCGNLTEGEEIIIAGLAPELSVDESLNEAICPGDIIELFTYFDLENPLPGVGVTLADITSDILQTELTLNPPLTLPDGSGGRYESVINILNAPEGAIVSEELELDSIWFNLEHSYGGDLEIEVICPDGTSALIINYPSGIGTTNFGEPYATGPVDGESFDLTPGIPYRYTAVENQELSFAEYADIAPIYQYTTVASTTTGNFYTYEDNYFPEGQYRSEETFLNFYGCPIRGEWKIVIQDNLGLDNGNIFGWGLAFTGASDSLIENTVTWQWEANPSITDLEENSIDVLVPDGNLTLSFEASDSYGCTSELDYTLNILPEDAPRCNGFSPSIPELEVNPFPWPNPFTGDINLNLTHTGPGLVQIINTNGHLVYEGRHDERGRIDGSSWPSGIYWLRIHQIEDNQIYSTRIVKQ